jgi:hypothetical protein
MIRDDIWPNTLIREPSRNAHASEMIRWHGLDAGDYENLWWLEYHGVSLYGPGLPAGTYFTHGAGVHILTVVPALKLVIVSRVDNDPQQSRPPNIPLRPPPRWAK